MSDAAEGGNKGRSLKEEVDALRDEANDLLGGLRQIFSASRDEVVRSAQLGRLRVDIYQQNKERASLMQSLGERVHTLVRSGAVELPSLSELLGRVADVDVLIAATQEKIDEAQIPSPSPSTTKAKKPTPKKTSAKEPQAKKSAAKKTPIKKTTAKKSAAKKPPIKKTTAKKATAKKSAAKKQPKRSTKKPANSPSKRGPGKTPKGS